MCVRVYVCASQKIARDCIRQYESALNPADASCAIGRLPTDESILRDAHANAQTTVLALFDRLSPTAPAVTTVFRKKIEVCICETVNICESYQYETWRHPAIVVLRVYRPQPLHTFKIC